MVGIGTSLYRPVRMSWRKGMGSSNSGNVPIAVSQFVGGSKAPIRETGGSDIEMAQSISQHHSTDTRCTHVWKDG